ncbi:hypothetical protein ACFPZJ_39140, partial [Streptomyces bullii]
LPRGPLGVGQPAALRIPHAPGLPVSTPGCQANGTDITQSSSVHSVCGFKSPIDYEREYRATLAEGLAA